MPRILIADDNPYRANLVQTVLKTHLKMHLGEVEYVTVEDGRDALEVWPSGFIGLVAACELPCMTGIDLIREIHAKGGKKMLVLYSNRDGVEAIAYQAGANRFFREPFDISLISDEFRLHLS